MLHDVIIRFTSSVAKSLDIALESGCFDVIFGHGRDSLIYTYLCRSSQ